MKWSEFKKLVDAELERQGVSDPEIEWIDISGGWGGLEHMEVRAQDGKLIID